MRYTLIAFVFMAIGCEQGSSVPVPKPAVTPAQATLETSVQEALPPKSKRTEYGLEHAAGGFKAAKWGESRTRYIGEPCIDSWTIHSDPAKLTVSGTTRSTNTGFIVGDANIFGGNLAISEKLTLLGKSDANGRPRHTL
jgi:hypothetical protein